MLVSIAALVFIVLASTQKVSPSLIGLGIVVVVIAMT